MFGIGWGEMLVVGLVALLVVGPDKLPRLARDVGRFYGQLRKAATEAGQGLSREVDRLEDDFRLKGDESLGGSLKHPTLADIKNDLKLQGPDPETGPFDPGADSGR